MPFHSERCTTKPIHIKTINENLFQDHLQMGILMTWLKVCNTLYAHASHSKHQEACTGNVDVNMDCWYRLLNDNNDAKIWKVINWKGECKPCVIQMSAAMMILNYFFRPL